MLDDWWETRAARESREVWAHRVQGALLGGLGVTVISGLLAWAFVAFS